MNIHNYNEFVDATRTCGVALSSGCLGGSEEDDAQSTSPTGGSDPSTTSTGVDGDTLYSVRETISFDNGIELTLEDYLVREEIRLEVLYGYTPTNTDLRYETEKSEPGSVFLMFKLHLKNTSETEHPMLASIDVMYKGETPSSQGFGTGTSRLVVIDGEATESLGYSRDQEGTYPGADIAGWVIDPVYLLPENFDTSGVRIRISIFDEKEATYRLGS